MPSRAAAQPIVPRPPRSSSQAAALALAIALAAGGAAAAPLPRFFGTEVWYHQVTNHPVHPGSSSMIATLAGLGGFGNGRMQIDFGMRVVYAAPGAPTRSIVTHSDYGYFAPDCEPLGSVMPVPADATIEGVDPPADGLICDNVNEDCHLLVVQDRTLYEAYAATASGPDELEALCLAVWNLDALYPPEGRGDHCTSADAAGFPIAPLLFNADEIAASLALDASGDGDLGHALRFILPNPRMASDASLPGSVNGRLYVRPASHAGGPSGPAGSVPYGSRLRLRADFPLTGYNAAARVLLNTMKRFGIVLADGGTVALTAENDQYTTAKWTELGIDARVFDLTPGAADVAITDFVVLDTGPRIAETYDCVRVAPTPVVFADGFESARLVHWSAAAP